MELRNATSAKNGCFTNVTDAWKIIPVPREWNLIGALDANALAPMQWLPNHPIL